MRLGKPKSNEFLFDPGTVDVVSIAADSTVELALVQADAWTDSEAQVQSFQEKVQTYVSYAVDGGLVAAYPEAGGLPWRIVVTSHAGSPDANVAYVIAALASRLPEYGGSIETRTSD